MTLEQLIYDQFPFVQCPLECGVGFHELIYRMCVEIDDLHLSIDQDEHEDICTMILQIKEKFGELRVTAVGNHILNGVDLIIDKYSELSKSTCEICGAEGKLIKDGYWIKVRCEDCSI